MTFIDESTSRQDLEIAARDAGLPILADTDALRASIIDWIEVGDECAAA